MERPGERRRCKGRERKGERVRACQGDRSRVELREVKESLCYGWDSAHTGSLRGWSGREGMGVKDRACQGDGEDMWAWDMREKGDDT